MKVHYTVKSLCEYGFPVLSEEIPMGKAYDVDPARTAPMTMTCGGCKKRIPVKGIWVKGNKAYPGGWLPSEIFDLGTKQLAE